MRFPGTRVTLAVLSAWLGVAGCVGPRGAVRPLHPGGPNAVADRNPKVEVRSSPAAVAELHGPPPPGVRTPDWLPRGEIFWERAVRYRLFSEPKLTLDDGMPKVGRGEEALIDGRVGFKLNVDGAAFFEHAGLEDIPDELKIRRLFFMTNGIIRFGHPAYYSLSIGFLSRSFYFDSASLEFRDLPWVGSFKLGGFDVPLSLDNLTSNRDRVFMELPAPVQAFVPSTRPGLQIGRSFKEARGTWRLGFFSAGQRREVGDQSTGLARIAGRATSLLRAPDDDVAAGSPELIHLGFGASYVLSEGVHYQARPESFFAPIAVNTGDIDSKNALVLDVEVAARRGPFSVQGEYLQAFANGSPTTTFPGLYVAAAYLLTGEVRPYDREQGAFGQVIPLRPLNVRARSFGAAECAARYSWVRLDDGPVEGGEMHVLSAGFNWYWNEYVRWQLGYEHAFINGNSGGPLDGRLHVLQARFQLVI